MPVITPAIQGQLLGLFSNSQNQAPQVANQLISAIVSGCSSVMKVMGPSPIPFMPVGMGGAIGILTGLFSNSQNQSSQVAQQIATAISLIDPTIPPSGLSTLQGMLTGLFSNSQNQPSQVAQQIANAVQIYYLSSGICI